MAAIQQDLVIEQGKTFRQVIYWGGAPIVYKPITAITNTPPATLTVAAHGVPNGWPVAITGVKGMLPINAPNVPPLRGFVAQGGDYHAATVIDANTIQLNEVNPINYPVYTSGGFIQYDTPVNLLGYTARMSIKDKIGGTEFLRLDTTNARILLDAVANTITLVVDAVTTAAITQQSGTYDLELVDAAGVVVGVMAGNVSVTKEVTTV